MPHERIATCCLPLQWAVVWSQNPASQTVGHIHNITWSCSEGIVHVPLIDRSRIVQTGGHVDGTGPPAGGASGNCGTI